MSSDLFVVEKAPGSILDYTLDWAVVDDPWLQPGDTITASAWVAQNGITLGDGTNGAAAPSFTDTTATVWALLGTLQADYLMTNTITTAAGRTHSRSVLVKVRTR